MCKERPQLYQLSVFVCAWRADITPLYPLIFLASVTPYLIRCTGVDHITCTQTNDRLHVTPGLTHHLGSFQSHYTLSGRLNPESSTGDSFSCFFFYQPNWAGATALSRCKLSSWIDCHFTAGTEDLKSQRRKACEYNGMCARLIFSLPHIGLFGMKSKWQVVEALLW